MGAPVTLDTAAIAFSGQIQQGKILFELFSEVVFGPPCTADQPIRFGEVLIPDDAVLTVEATKSDGLARAQHRLRAGSSTTRHRPRSRHFRAKVVLTVEPPASSFRMNLIRRQRKSVSNERYLLVLTPACDLIRCAPSKSVLCVEGSGSDYSDFRSQTREKLYGKHTLGLRHLLQKKNAVGETASTLITWHRDRTSMYSVRELATNGFSRIALMNELYAQEVKEEVLRELGRIGTQIDPPPAFALHATLKWKAGDQTHSADTPKDSFYSALLTYSEQRDEKPATSVVLSDEFRLWAGKRVVQDTAPASMNPKLAACLKAMSTQKQFLLKSSDMSCKVNELLVRVVDEPSTKMSANTLFEIELISDKK